METGNGSAGSPTLTQFSLQISIGQYGERTGGHLEWGSGVREGKSFRLCSCHDCPVSRDSTLFSLKNENMQMQITKTDQNSVEHMLTESFKENTSKLYGLVEFESMFIKVRLMPSFLEITRYILFRGTKLHQRQNSRRFTLRLRGQ